MIYREILKIIHFHHFDSDPRFPQFYYMLGGNLGSLLYGDISMMYAKGNALSFFFLMNVFFALKGSKLFIIISYHCNWMLCRVVAVTSLPALIYNADYILLLVL